MEEPTAPTPDPVVKKRGSKITLILIIALVLALLAGGYAFWWRNNQADQQKKADAAKITELETEVKTLKEVATADTDISTSPSDSVKENIIASIKTGNTAALEGYMASSVHVAIAATEAIFDRTPAKTIADLDYISDATAPWNFAIDAATLAVYASGDYKDYFHDNSIVGVSADLKVVVISFDASGDINDIFMAINTSLL